MSELREPPRADDLDEWRSTPPPQPPDHDHRRVTPLPAPPVSPALRSPRVLSVASGSAGFGSAAHAGYGERSSNRSAASSRLAVLPRLSTAARLGARGARALAGAALDRLGWIGRFGPFGRTALLIGALAAVGIVHVWSRTRVTAVGYRLGELQRTQESLRAQRDRLEVEVATLRAPGRLEEFARTRLKMAPPAPGAVVAGRAAGSPLRSGTAEAQGARGATGPMVATARTR